MAGLAETAQTTAASGKRIAVMQPYFFPYAGYFRLLREADEFVIYDSVQYSKGSRVGRSEVAGHGDRKEWLTLPFAIPPLGTLIQDLAFASGAREEFDRRLRRHSWIAKASGPAADRVRDYLHAPFSTVVDYLEDGLRLVADLVGIHTPILRSSSLRLDPSLRGQARVLAVVAARQGTIYLNAPGGRSLYDASVFQQRGVTLRFLPQYRGQFKYLLPALLSEAPQRIASDLEVDLYPSSPSGQ